MLRQIQCLDVELSELVRNTLISGADIVSSAMADDSEAGPWRTVKEIVDDLLSGNVERIARQFDSGATAVMLGKHMVYLEELPKHYEFIIRIDLGKRADNTNIDPFIVHSSSVTW